MNIKAKKLDHKQILKTGLYKVYYAENGLHVNCSMQTKYPRLLVGVQARVFQINLVFSIRISYFLNVNKSV